MLIVLFLPEMPATATAAPVPAFITSVSASLQLQTLQLQLMNSRTALLAGPFPGEMHQITVKFLMNTIYSHKWQIPPTTNGDLAFTQDQRHGDQMGNITNTHDDQASIGYSDRHLRCNSADARSPSTSGVCDAQQ